MKLFLKLLAFLIVLAVALPFLLRDENGKPLLRLDHLKMPQIGVPDLPEMPDVGGAVKKAGRSLQKAVASHEKTSPRGPEKPIYTWRDADGTLHFSDRPNPDGASEEVRLNPEANRLPVRPSPPVAVETAGEGDRPKISFPSPTSIPLSEVPALIDRAGEVSRQAASRERQRQTLLEE